MVKRQGLKIFVVAECLALISSLGVQAFAVWPPSTMLQEEASKPASTDVQEPVIPRPRGLVDRLEDDEKRLDHVLRDLQKDTKDMKQEAVHLPEVPTGDVKSGTK
jgi:hypothetical protein